MTRQEFAALINGREYPFDLAKFEEDHAKQNRLLVIFGASDDLVELRGAIHDERGAPCALLIDGEGNLLADFEGGDEEVLTRHGVLAEATLRRQHSIRVDALWCDASLSPAWTYRTEREHSTFDIMEDGEVYCRGL